MALTIGIIGAGTIGAGIAHVAALHTCSVYLYDIYDDVVKRSVERINAEFQKSVDKNKFTAEEMAAAISRIKPRTQIGDLDVCDIIIEAVIEDVRVKKDLFKKLDTIAHHSTILATNTSSISVTSIASVTKKPERVVGMHFFHPVHTMKLVEVVSGEHTSSEVLQRTLDAARKLGKTPVLAKDTPGFIVNRIARPFYGEALRLLDEGVASFEEIDRIVKRSGGFKSGPFETMDATGIDDNFAVTQSMYEQCFHEPRFRPHRIQKQMVESGKLGKKTKKGFYDYSEENKKPF